MIVVHFYPIRLQASLHTTLWGGRRLAHEQWKQLPPNDIAIGEAWETEVSTLIENGPYIGRTLGDVVTELGPSLLGKQASAIFGHRFPLLAKFIDANAKLSVQVHPNDQYARQYEGGKLGKTEFWYILAAQPGASIVHGFQSATPREAVQQAIQTTTLESLLHEEPVQAGDVIFVPAGTVHAIGSGILLYELQEYSDVTYRMYDYGRLDGGKPRELHIDRSLDVSHYDRSRQVKMQPVSLPGTSSYEDRCLVACQYFLTRELNFKPDASFDSTTSASCIILTSIGAGLQISYGDHFARSESLARGQTIVLPAELGRYHIEGSGAFLLSYVPTPNDEAWELWRTKNA